MHFVLAGALLFGAERWWRAASEAARDTAASDNADPFDRGAAQDALEREALRLGLDRGDRLVRDRLVKLGRFLGLAEPADEDALEREARALGLQREDPVIRRYLAQQMQTTLAGPASYPEEEEVRRRYHTLAAETRAPTRLSLAHVYLGRDRRGAALQGDAESLLSRLRSEGVRPEQAGARGDPFAIGSRIGPATVAEIGRLFGVEFAAGLEDAPTERWWGPVRSSYGLHLVWISERSSQPPPDLAAVRNQIVWSLVRERQAERLRRGLVEIRARGAE